MKNRIMGMISILKNTFLKKRIENMFLVLALCFGVIMAILNPPFQECDGWIHFLRAVDVSYGNVFSPVKDILRDDGFVVIPKNIDEIDYRITEPGSGDGKNLIYELKSMEVSKSQAIGDVTSNTSFMYYPQAFGMFLGRIFGLSMYGMIQFGKIVNLLCFILLVYLAIRITPVLKTTLAVIALFPITVYQASSLSPDAMLNGLCFLFLALCFYDAWGKEKLNYKDALKLGILLGLISLCKYVYILIGLVVFLIPRKKFNEEGKSRKYWKCFGIALIPVFLLSVTAMMAAFGVALNGQAVGDIAAVSDTAVAAGGMTQIQFLMQHPKAIIQILITTLMTKFTDWMLWLNMLGSLNYPLGPLIYIVPMYAMFVGALDRGDDSEKMCGWQKMLCLLTFMVVSVIIIMSLYIGDGRINPVGSMVVQGVQGRYFVPVIPLLFAGILQKGQQQPIKFFTEKAMGGMAAILLYAVHVLYGCCW